MRIVHLADLHLGYRAYYKLNPHGFNIRELDVIEAFREALRKINELKPDLIIIAGDIFHKPRPSNLTIYQTIQRLLVFRKHCQAPIIIVSGNHESVKSLDTGNVLNILETVIPNLFVIDGSIKEIELKNLDMLFAGVPYNALPELKNKTVKPDKSYKYNILSVHGSYDSVKCQELSRYGTEELITADKISLPEWDYIAFGHYHKFTKLADNCYYSGAIERTSTNIWQEAKDAKGFIEFDLDKKECKFHALTSPRNVVDIKRINANNMTGEDINSRITEEMAKIKSLEDSIVRITFENLDPITIKNIDYKQIRQYKKNAVHFRLNLIKKDSVIKTLNPSENPVEVKKGIHEYLEEELAKFELSQGLDKDKFDNLAKVYLHSKA